MLVSLRAQFFCFKTQVDQTKMFRIRLRIGSATETNKKTIQKLCCYTISVCMENLHQGDFVISRSVDNEETMTTNNFYHEELYKCMLTKNLMYYNEILQADDVSIHCKLAELMCHDMKTFEDALRKMMMKNSYKVSKNIDLKLTDAREKLLKETNGCTNCCICDYTFLNRDTGGLRYNQFQKYVVSIYKLRGYAVSDQLLCEEETEHYEDFVITLKKREKKFMVNFTAGVFLNDISRLCQKLKEDGDIDVGGNGNLVMDLPVFKNRLWSAIKTKYRSMFVSGDYRDLFTRYFKLFTKRCICRKTKRIQAELVSSIMPNTIPTTLIV